MIGKLQRKFVLSAVLAIFLVLTVIMGIIQVMNYQKLAANADQLLTLLADNGGKFPKRPPGEGRDGNPAMKRMSPETPFESRYFTVELGQNGDVLAVDTGQIAAVDDETAAAYAEQVSQKSRASGFAGQYRYLIRETGEGTLIIFLDCNRELSGFRSSLFNSAVVSVIGMVSVFVLILFFSKIILKPVIESYRKQKQFITDAGHELKTPLTIISANVELLEMDYGENKWTGSIRSQVARLSSLTSDLIALSRMEEDSKLTLLDFSLSDAVQETAEPFAVLAETQGKAFEIEICPELSYCGDEKLIRRLISVLLDNAIKYSEPGGDIRVSLQRQGRKSCLAVYNTTQEIPKGSLLQLFDRFYRTDRSRNSRTGGHGIGLSVARAIVEAHKGKITACSADGVSLTITVLL